MPDVVTRGTMLESTTVTDIFNSVKGHSALAKICPNQPVSFNGNDYFVFSMDDECAIVGEGEKKSRGTAALKKVTMRPIKLEYGARFSDEFIYGTDEAKLDILTAFVEGAAKKFARAIDIAGIHGLNPRTKTTATSLGSNYIDAAVVATGNAVTYNAADPEANLETAVGMLGERDVNGFAFSKGFAADMAKLKVNGVKQYPEFALGANPGTLNGSACDVNSTVNFDTNADRAIIGDFTAFKWGYAKQLPLDVIQYGDPDNSGRDLKGYNEVYLRTEAYIGFAVLDNGAFAAVKAGE